MKIAIVTLDGKTVSQHFGRSPYYTIYTIENKEIKNKELRERKSAHGTQQKGDSGYHNHSRGHGFGPANDKKHDAMIEQISDCQVLIAGGMGRGAYERFFKKGINVIMTDKTNIENVVNSYIKGELNNLYNERTH